MISAHLTALDNERRTGEILMRTALTISCSFALAPDLSTTAAHTCQGRVSKCKAVRSRAKD